ncbi:MAG: type III-B CRISPR module RAMP protein Cmr1 [Thiomicrospira sp.]
MPRVALTAMPENNLHARFEIITPMFLGDADQKATSIRPTAIKGALRFWWRAINAHLDLKELAEQEAKLFGSAKQDVGRGCFSIHVTECDAIGSPDASWPIKDPNAPSSYLGYGLVGDNQNPHREAIKAGIKFTVVLQFSPDATQSDRQAIQVALEAFGIFGSLGSRARRGFGSVQLLTLNDQPFIQMTPSNIREWLGANLASSLKDASSLGFTGFSKDSRFAMPHAINNKSFSDFKSCHASLGLIYKNARTPIKPTRLRAVFGLPLKSVNESLRRASPVFIKVIKDTPKTYQGLFLFLPSQFHPEYTQADFDYIKPMLNEIKAENCI